MSYSLEEQETHLSLDRLSDRWWIYTSDTRYMNKLDKRVEGGEYKLENVIKDCDGTLMAKEYSCPINLISFRTKTKHRELTEEQRLELAERLRKARESQNAQNQF